MKDLYWGMAIIAAISVAAFVVMLLITRRSKAWLVDATGLLVLLSMVLYIRDVWDHQFLVRWLPYSNLIILSNFMPIFAGLLAACAFRRVPGNVWRKSIPVVVLAGVGIYALISPVLGTPPACENFWEDGVCRQTTEATCAAASSATLLTRYGIPATEGEMAELCLTRKGTTWLGIYRGLKLKTEGTDWEVEVFRTDYEHLEDFDPPFLLTVGLEPGTTDDPRYERDWGWIPGVSHSVVLLRFLPSGQTIIGDPAVGQELWSEKDFEILWHGEGIRLVKKK